MTTLPFAGTQFCFKLMPQGSWDWTVYGGWREQPKRVVPAVTCPLCNRLFALANHQVAADGSVTPSVVCTREGCSWHVMVTLVGYHNPKPIL